MTSAENPCALTTVRDTRDDNELGVFHGNTTPPNAAFQRKICSQVLATTARRARQVSLLLFRLTRRPYFNSIQAYHEPLSMGPRSDQLLSIYLGRSQTVASQDGLYLYTRLDRTRKKYHVSLSRMAQSE